MLHHRIGDEEIIESFDASTGKSLWHHSYPSHFIDPYGYNNGPRGTPLLTADRCYTFGAEGKLVCLELQTGKLVWQRDTGIDWNVPAAFFGVGSSPILEGNLLLVMVGGQPNSGMVAFDASTGKTGLGKCRRKKLAGPTHDRLARRTPGQMAIMGKAGQLFDARRCDHTWPAPHPLPHAPGPGFAEPNQWNGQFQLLVSLPGKRFS